ncbi:hypothetical protein AB9M93_26235 [Peribacillus frigoritolerans]|uniref:hypothetical protein n=1 Tax=Peribacillus frigoritolerans TaxID=450367 RepID=UPI003514402D
MILWSKFIENMTLFTWVIYLNYEGDVDVKEQLKKAKENKVKEFIVVGELAEKLYKTQKISKLSKRAAIALAGANGVGAVAAPFNAGGSLGIAALAIGTAATTVGTGTIIAAIAVGGVLLVYSIYKDYTIIAEYVIDEE